MKRELEDELERRVRAGEFPRNVIDEFVREGKIANPKQAWRTLEKWDRQGRYEWGVTIDLGWFRDEQALANWDAFRAVRNRQT